MLLTLRIVARSITDQDFKLRYTVTTNPQYLLSILTILEAIISTASIGNKGSMPELPSRQFRRMRNHWIFTAFTTNDSVFHSLSICRRPSWIAKQDDRVWRVSWNDQLHWTTIFHCKQAYCGEESEHSRLDAIHNSLRFPNRSLTIRIVCGYHL